MQLESYFLPTEIMNLNTSLPPYQRPNLSLPNLPHPYVNTLLERTSVNNITNSNTNEQALSTTAQQNQPFFENDLTSDTSLKTLGSGNEDMDEANNNPEREALPPTKEFSTSRTKERSKFSSNYSEDDVPLTFPQRLMEMLSNEDHSDIIAWLPHGQGFMIYQKKRFAEQILPKYFKKTKFTSFTRKLNRWSFNRVTRGPESGAYYHPFFQRGNLRLCLQMCCQTTTKMTKAQEAGQYSIFSPQHTIPSSTTMPSVANMNHQCIMSNAMSSLQINNRLPDQQQQQHPQLQQPIVPVGAMQTSASTGVGASPLPDVNIGAIDNNGENSIETQFLNIQLEQQRQQILQMQQLLQQPVVTQLGTPQQQEGSLQTSPQQQEEQQHLTQDEMDIFDDHNLQPTPLRPSHNQVFEQEHQEQHQPLPYQNLSSTSIPPVESVSKEVVGVGIGVIAPTPTPASEAPDPNSKYSQSVVNAAISALERSNQPTFLSAEMVQEQVKATYDKSQQHQQDTSSSISSNSAKNCVSKLLMAISDNSNSADNRAPLVDLQKQQAELLRDQQRQLEGYAKQWMLQPATTKQCQQEFPIFASSNGPIVTSPTQLPQYSPGMEKRAKAA